MSYRWFWAYLLFFGGVLCSFTYDLTATVCFITASIITATTNFKSNRWFLVTDIILLTICLWATGGAHNPLSVLFLVPIAVSAISLTPLWTWALAGLSSVLYSTLFFIFRDFPLFTSHYYHLQESSPFSFHLWGMLIGFSLVALFLAFFFTKLSMERLQQANDIALLSEREKTLERLLGVTSLAASTAHEINTPLSTIKLIAFDLPSSEDKDLLISEVLRCEDAIRRLRLALGDLPYCKNEKLVLSEIIRLLHPRFNEKDRQRIKILEDGEFASQRFAISEALFAIIKNALDFSGNQIVEISVEGDIITVEDKGNGISEDIVSQIGKPINSDRGLGLGLFLSKRFIEIIGGDISFKSGKGTKVFIHLNREQERGHP